MNITAVIITFNEERNIARCIESLHGVADEIVVVDSGSTDQTISICESLNVKPIRQDWLGYSAQKNFANGIATNNWILSIDADEALSDELKQSILQLKNAGSMSVCSFNRCTNYCGTWIRHGGWYPDTKVRIFDRNKVRWTGEIHEQLIGFESSDVVHLKGDLLHYSYYSEEDHIRQTEKFTTLSAEDLFKKGKKAGWMKMYLSPISRFISGYIFRLGFLDGKAGFRIAVLSAGATRKKYTKLNQLYKTNHD
jgi:glycosyltransferase involved in cell wall biosynthesis